MSPRHVSDPVGSQNAAEPATPYPRCIAGRGQAPEEDSGGIWAAKAAGGPFGPDETTEALAALAVPG